MCLVVRFDDIIKKQFFPVAVYPALKKIYMARSKLNFLSIDIGTTGCKTQLLSEEGLILEYLFEEYDFRYVGNEKYVDMDAVVSCLEKMIRKISLSDEFSSVCISSLGESFVLLDREDNILFYPMLYTDRRGEKEAGILSGAAGADRKSVV